MRTWRAAERPMVARERIVLGERNKLLVLRNVRERVVSVIDDCLVIGGN
jgi:hypothetical protein